MLSSGLPKFSRNPKNFLLLIQIQLGEAFFGPKLIDFKRLICVAHGLLERSRRSREICGADALLDGSDDGAE